MSHRVYIGTSGWNYDHWKGIFYPKELPTSGWLAHYAHYFDSVEINYSFYRLPERADFEKWRAETPEDFTFAVKASRYLTHRKKLREPAEPLDRMMSRVRGLQEKLGPILYQLPPRWKVNLERLREFLSLLPRDVRHVMEFRDPTWQTDEVCDLLRAHSVGYCIMSAPDLPRIMVVTAPFAYIRMHNGGYDTEGNYEDAQLEWWAGQIASLANEVEVYTYFNNDYRGFAVRNALTLKRMLGI